MSTRRGIGALGCLAMREGLGSVLIGSDGTLRDCIATINRGGAGIALVVDEEGHLRATITDGDVRRAFLAGADSEDHVADWLPKSST